MINGKKFLLAMEHCNRLVSLGYEIQAGMSELLKDYIE